MQKRQSYSFKPFGAKEVWITLGFLLISTFAFYGQDQVLADSLEMVYTIGRFEEKDRLPILNDLAKNHPNPDRALQYSEELLRRAKALDSIGYIVGGYLQKGNNLKLKGDLSQALESYLEGVKIATSANKKREIGLLNLSIAGVYQVMGNNENTIRYYKEAIPIFKEVEDTLNYANALENLGDYYNLALVKPDSALLFFEESGAIFQARNSKTGIAYNMGNKGLAYAQLGQNIIAEEKIRGAISLLEELGDYYPICVYLTYMADIYAQRGDLNAAFDYAEKSLGLAKQYGLKDQISDANLKLSELYEKKGDAASSLKYFKAHIVFKDSVKNITTVQQMANLQMDRKEIELNLLNQQRKTQKVINIAIAIALFLIGVLAFGLYRRNRFIRRTKQIIEQERDRSESLLHNILPEETAEELKKNGRVEAKKFESVTVLFTDFKGFTHYAENLSPEKLVESVGHYFSKFDDIMEKYGLEKIKTIGDSYMCAGGLPFPTKDHASKMLHAAFEILDFVNASKADESLEHTSFDIRIGINTGPIVAGVVGSKKFSYDIWGDTVNVASRMETMSEPGKINISENTYELIRGEFDCEPRGEIFVKNRGMMQMYYVKAKNDQANDPKITIESKMKIVKTIQ